MKPCTNAPLLKGAFPVSGANAACGWVEGISRPHLARFLSPLHALVAMHSPLERDRKEALREGEASLSFPEVRSVPDSAERAQSHS